MPRERKGVAERKSNLRFPYKLFIVASEGADTERIYFEAVAQLAAANIHKRANIKIEYLNRLSEAERKESGHTKVVAQLDEYKKNYLLEETDELWLVIDRDKNNNPIKNIAAIAQLCEQKNYNLAISNPTFELWLLLHLVDLDLFDEAAKLNLFENKYVNKTKRTLEKELSTYLNGYNKSKYDASQLLPNINTAIDQAKKLDIKPEERWLEDSLNSRVYRLMQNILSEIS
jgi:hypothetical protein